MKRSAAFEAAKDYWAKKYKSNDGDAIGMENTSALLLDADLNSASKNSDLNTVTAKKGDKSNNDKYSDEGAIDIQNTSVLLVNTELNDAVKDTDLNNAEIDAKNVSVINVDSVDDLKPDEGHIASSIPESVDLNRVRLDSAPGNVNLNNNKSNFSPIRLLYNPSHIPPNPLANQDTIKISDILQSPNMSRTFQFNFNVDLTFILSLFHNNFKAKQIPITFITGSELPELVECKTLYNLSHVVAKVPNRYGTHHTKMMVNFYDDDEELEIVIMTLNYTKLDLGGLTQMLWKSEKLKKGRTSENRGKLFQSDLNHYLLKYDNPILTLLAESLFDYDFLGIDVELLSSAPGTYNISDDITHGYGKLHKILKRNDLLCKKSEQKINILSQVTSIAYPINSDKFNTGSLFTHLLCPLIFSKTSRFRILQPGSESSIKHQQENNYLPQIIFPTVSEITAATVGFGSGQAVHYNYTSTVHAKNQYNQNIKPYLHKWNSSGNKTITGRETVTPHVKFLMCDNGDNWKSLKWVVMGSHNLSKQAWGCPKGSKYTNGNPDVFEVASYELSVVIVPEKGKKLIPSFNSNKGFDEHAIPIRFPFVLPPIKYNDQDIPWDPKLNYPETYRDNFGNVYDIN